MTSHMVLLFAKYDMGDISFKQLWCQTKATLTIAMEKNNKLKVKSDIQEL